MIQTKQSDAQLATEHVGEEELSDLVTLNVRPDDILDISVTIPSCQEDRMETAEERPEVLVMEPTKFVSLVGPEEEEEEVKEEFGTAEQLGPPPKTPLTEEEKERRRHKEACKWVCANSSIINPRERGPEGTFKGKVCPSNNIKF